jgi:subtilase family serine protease
VRFRTRPIAVLTALAASVTAFLIPAGGALAASGSSSDDVVFHVHPPKVRSSLSAKAIRPALTPAECLAQTAGRVACQDPASIRAAYDIPSTVKGKPAGTGQTIVIVDAFGSPTLQSDLDTFSTAFGLPRTTVQVHYPDGKPAFHGSANQVGWAEETSLDVQWAHAVAPGAKIALVVAATNYGNALNNAQRYAVSHHLGNVMSLSFGIPEAALRGNNGQILQSSKIYAQAKAAGITVFASSGDDGSDNLYGTPNFAFPAADPNVTAVGGTNLWAGSGQNQPRETVWGDYADCPLTCAFGPIGATGGAPSLVTGKQGSDVAYNASVYTGVLTYLGFLGAADNGFYYFGGTSASSPQWAAVTAILDQARGSSLGYIRDDIAGWARSGALYDVTKGSNATPTYKGGFSATGGHDLPTGYGTPDVRKLIGLTGGSL